MFIAVYQSKIIRPLYPCPELSAEELEEYPIVSDTEVFKMIMASFETRLGICFFPYIQKNRVGELYIDIYVVEVKEKGREERFVLTKGYQLPRAKEERFLTYLASDNYWFESEVYAKFLDDLTQYLRADKKSRDFDNHSMVLEYLYFTFHRSGPKECLYKANLNNIAYCLNNIEEYNIIGGSPSQILGVPLKLLRILNQERLLTRLYTASSREYAKNIYERYRGHIGESYPNATQWKYLELLYEKNMLGEGELFRRKIYNELGEEDDDVYLDYYECFFENKEILGDYFFYHGVPSCEELEEVIERQIELMSLLDREEMIDSRLRKIATRSNLNYENSEFEVRMPRSLKELAREAISQSNCLLSYIRNLVEEKLYIVFVRKKTCPDKSFLTVEISLDKYVVQALGPYNRDLDEEELQYINEYSICKGLD